MSKNNQNKKILDGVNRCDRCNRPLSNPAANYGWRCAQIIGLNNYYKIADSLDSDELLIYNEYVFKYLADDMINNSIIENVNTDSDTTDNDVATIYSDITKYDEGTKVHTSLLILQEAYEAFPEYGSAIADLSNEIKWIGNEWGTKKIDNMVKLGLFTGTMRGLSTIEQVISAAYPSQALAINNARNESDKLTYEIYNQEGNNVDVANAFKHIYWSAYATSKIGAEYTKLFTNAHEFGWYMENKNNPEAMKMDLHNNQRGRIIGQNYPLHRLEEAVLKDIASGNAFVIKNGKSVLTTPEWRSR